MISSEMKVERVDIKGDLGVVNAARVSMGKWHPEFNEMTDTRLINYLAEHNHWSPFAHPQLHFRMKAPIFIARQLQKHQVGFVWNECFSEDTEVLTESGWKYWPEVTEDDLIATPRQDGESYAFKKPIELVKNEYKGDMVHIYSRDLDMLVTPNHDQFISYYSGKKGNEWTEFEKMRTVDAVKKKFAKTMKMPSVDYPEGNDYWEGKLYGAFIGDGSLSDDKERIYFHVKKDKKKLMLRELSEHTKDYVWNENEQNDGYSYFRIKNISGWTGHVHTKEINIYKRTKSFLKGLYDGLVETDGHVTERNNTSFSTTSKPMVKTLEELAYLLGFDTTIHIREKQGNWNEAYKYTFKFPRPKLLKNSEIVQYNGTVYCAKTETGLLIVRRNGKSCVSGNCSRRYVDVTPEFYFPVPRRRAPNVKQGSMDEAVERRYYCEEEMYFTTSRALQSYETLLQEGVAPEVARAVLPQNMMTEWIWTGSLYGFWRVVKLRADSHAQKESQEIAHMLLKLLREEYPVSIAALEKADGKDFGGNDGN